MASRPRVKGLASDLEVQIIGDSLRLNQVLSNLLSNALKFTPAKGIIKLRVSKTGEDQENVYLRFEVIDTGCGIAEENYDKIFESFEQEMWMSLINMEAQD